MASQHKHPPLSYRPPKDSGDEEWIRAYAGQAGTSIKAVFTESVREFRERHQDPATTPDPKENDR